MVLRKAKVCCDGLGTFEGYVEDNRSWNGWTMPWFTMEESMKIMEAVNAQVNEYVMSKLVYDDYLKAFIEVTMYLGDDKKIHETETSVYEGVHDMRTEDGGVAYVLFPIGNSEWCWYEVTEKDRE